MATIWPSLKSSPGKRLGDFQGNTRSPHPRSAACRDHPPGYRWSRPAHGRDNRRPDRSARHPPRNKSCGCSAPGSVRGGRGGCASLWCRRSAGFPTLAHGSPGRSRDRKHSRRFWAEAERRTVRSGKIDAVTIGADDRRIGPRKRCRVCRQTVLHQFQDQPFRHGDGRIMVGSRRDDAGRQRRDLGQRLPPAPESVARHDPGAGAVEIVKRKAELDMHRPTAAWRGGGTKKRTDRGGNAFPPGKYRDHGRQRLHIMRRVPQQEVPVQRRLRDQPELSGFQVLDAAMDQPGRRGRGA